MARLNLEDQFWLDIVHVAVKVGDMDRAIGNAARFLKFAQEKHKTGRLVTLKEFKDQGFDEALIPFFAERVEDEESGVVLIRARGAEKHFAWINQKREAGARGGRSRSEAKIKNLKQNRSGTEAEPKRNQAKTPKRTEAKPSETEASISISISNSISSSSSNSPSTSSSISEKEPRNEDRVTAPVKPSRTPESQALARLIWDSYREAYTARYLKEPVRNATVNSQICRLAERLGQDAPDVVRFYVGHNKTYYASRCHPIGLCLTDAESLHTQWVRGKAITNADIKRFERAVEADSLNKLIEEGKI